MRSFGLGISVNGTGADVDILIVGKLLESCSYFSQFFQIVSQLRSYVPFRNREVQVCLSAQGTFLTYDCVRLQVVESELSVREGICQ